MQNKRKDDQAQGAIGGVSRTCWRGCRLAECRDAQRDYLEVGPDEDGMILDDILSENCLDDHFSAIGSVTRSKSKADTLGHKAVVHEKRLIGVWRKLVNNLNGTMTNTPFFGVYKPKVSGLVISETYYS